jgi:hypothetical protein
VSPAAKLFLNLSTLSVFGIKSMTNEDSRVSCTKNNNKGWNKIHLEFNIARSSPCS